MKVKELIEKLKAFPDDLEVWTEGCDCYGDIGEVEIAQSEDEETNKIVNQVYLRRGLT